MPSSLFAGLPYKLPRIVNHSGARVLISEPELFAKVEKIRSSLPDVEQYYLISRHSHFSGV